MTASGTITVDVAPTISLSSAVGSDAQAVCLGNPITNITYAIGGGATGASVTGLPAGVSGSYSGGVFTISGTPSTAVGSPFNYTVTTSGGSCVPQVSKTGSITVNEIPVVTATPASQTICSGTPTSIALTSSLLGTTYAWTVVPTNVTGASSGAGSTIGQTLTATGSTSGTAVYTVIPTSNGCAGLPITVTINVTSPIIDNATFQLPNCNASDGSITLIPSGGAAATYTEVWSGTFSPLLPGNTSITNLPAGSYSVIITDGSVLACSATFSYLLNNPNAPVVSVVSSNVTCNNACDGIAKVTAVGGSLIPVVGYLYSWSGGQTTDSISGLCGSTNNVTVTDAAGCIALGSAIIVNPLPILANAIVLDPTCNASCNGSINLNPSGGTGSIYSYLWTSGPIAGQTTSSVSNLCANGNPYSFNVIDSMACSATFVVSLIDPLPIPIMIDTILANCNAHDGSIVVTPTIPSHDYIFSWSALETPPPAVILSTIDSTNGTQLSAGLYHVTVTNGIGCSKTFAITLNNLGGPSATANTIVDVSCHGICSGVASIDGVTGGVGPYTYLWNDLAATVNDTAKNLCAGTYNVKVTDANGCVYNSPIVIGQPTPLTFASTIVPASCNGVCNGSIVTNVSGGTPSLLGLGYTYTWSPGNPVGQGTNSISGLCFGTYTLTITDSTSCIHVDSFTVGQSHPLTAVISTKNLVCATNCNGAASVQITTGNGLYTYVWNDPLNQTNDTAIALCIGKYDVTIGDSLGCSIVLDTTITAPSSITAVASITSANCGACNGQATLVASGGLGPFTYSWSNGDTTNLADSLCSAVYSVSITDSVGCAANIIVPVSNLGGITSIAISSTPVTCFGLCDGAVTAATPVGGIPPFTYNWLPGGQTTSTINNLCAGTYFVQIADSTGCAFIDSVTISEPPSISFNTIINAPDCNLSNGSICVNPTGCSGAYTYMWNGNPALSLSCLSGLPAGIDSVKITCSASSCSQTVIVPLNNTNGPILTTTSIDPTCANNCNGSAGVVVTNGVPNYIYSWSTVPLQTTSTATGLCYGTYYVQVTTGNGCIGVSSATLTAPASIGFNLASTVEPLCNGGTDDTLTVVPFGGTLQYVYSWSPVPLFGQGTPTVAGFVAGIANTLTITDANGCTAQQSTTVGSPTKLTIVHDSTNASCNTIADGKVNVTVSGGIPMYNYLWNGNPLLPNNDSLSGLLTATYSVSVTDSHGCIIKDSIFVPATVSVFANAGRDTMFCQSGAYILNGSGSSINVTNYNWYQIQTPTNILVGNSASSSVNPAIDTTHYYLQVDNGFGCSNFDSVDVIVNPLPDADAGSNITILNGYGVTIGGNPTSTTGAIYTWTPLVEIDNNTSANPTVNPSSTTVYTVIVSTALGCSVSDSVVVTVVPNIVHGNGITPNGDGANDEWIIDNIELFPNCVVEVYNRWGELLFQSVGYKEHWKGVFKGQSLPVGTYYYIINLNDAKFPEPETGPITIVR